MAPTFVLIPGAGGDAWGWQLVDAELRRRGHDVVRVALPGADLDAGLAEYVEVVVAAAAGLDRVALVGQSLGGFTAAAACARLPVSLLVFVNAMIPNPGETAGEWWANTGQAQARADTDRAEGRDPDAAFDVMTYFLHDVPEQVLATADGPPPEESDAVFGSPSMLDHWPDVPTRVIVGRDDRFFPAEFQRRVAEERLGVTPDEIPGGHLAALSHPVELTDLLESYLAAL
jgi:pimeloyl-ACP methyl ester carboxylesterase